MRGLGWRWRGLSERKEKRTTGRQLSVYLPRDPPEHTRRPLDSGRWSNVGPMFIFIPSIVYGSGSGVDNEIPGC